MSDPSTEFCLILTTTAHENAAAKIAGILLDQRLAACVQIDGPIRSHYRWDGKVQADEEYRLCIKSRRALYPRIEATIREHHAYDQPQIIATPIVAGDAGYLKWVAEETAD